MPLEQNTYDLYRGFADYCRTGKYKALPGVRADRASNYLRLVTNIIHDNLRKAYPVTVSALGTDEWNKLVYEFFSTWDLPSPQLWKMPRELYEFVCQSGYAGKIAKPYLEDLLYFEWIEIEVYMMPDAKYPATEKTSDLMRDTLVVNAEHEILRFEYPVFKLAADELDLNRGEYFVVCFRHPQSLNVKFMEVSGFFARFLQLLSAEPRRASEALRTLCSEMNAICDQEMEISTADFLTALEQQGMIVGALKE